MPRHAEASAKAAYRLLLLGYQCMRLMRSLHFLSPEELAKLAAYIARHDSLAWNQQLEDDFAPGGKHEKEARTNQCGD